MKVERNSPARGTRSVAQAAYAKRAEASAGPAAAETVAPPASVLANRSIVAWRCHRLAGSAMR